MQRGVQTHGVGAWEVIRQDLDFACLRDRSGVQLKDKWRNLVKFKHLPRTLVASLSAKPKTSWRAHRRARAAAACERDDEEQQTSQPFEEEPVKSEQEQQEPVQRVARLSNRYRKRVQRYDDACDSDDSSDLQYSEEPSKEDATQERRHQVQRKSRRRRRQSPQDKRFGIYDTRRYCLGQGPLPGQCVGDINVKAEAGELIDMEALGMEGMESEESYDDAVVDCPCGVNFDDGQMMIECESCKAWAHTHCLQAQPGATPDKYDNDFECYTCARCASMLPALGGACMDAGAAGEEAAGAALPATAAATGQGVPDTNAEDLGTLDVWDDDVLAALPLEEGEGGEAGVDMGSWLPAKPEEAAGQHLLPSGLVSPFAILSDEMPPDALGTDSALPAGAPGPAMPQQGASDGAVHGSSLAAQALAAATMGPCKSGHNSPTLAANPGSGLLSAAHSFLAPAQAALHTMQGTTMQGTTMNAAQGLLGRVEGSMYDGSQGMVPSAEGSVHSTAQVHSPAAGPRLFPVVLLRPNYQPLQLHMAIPNADNAACSTAMLVQGSVHSTNTLLHPGYAAAAGPASPQVGQSSLPGWGMLPSPCFVPAPPPAAAVRASPAAPLFQAVSPTASTLYSSDLSATATMTHLARSPGGSVHGPLFSSSMMPGAPVEGALGPMHLGSSLRSGSLPGVGLHSGGLQLPRVKGGAEARVLKQEQDDGLLIGADYWSKVAPIQGVAEDQAAAQLSPAPQAAQYRPCAFFETGLEGLENQEDNFLSLEQF